MNTTTEELSLRFDALREKHNKDIADKESLLTPFPLWALLILYERANTECYIEYMAGFKLLVNWLSPVAYPTQEGIEYNIQTLGSYETQQIASILNTYNSVIIKCLIEEVLPKMNEYNRGN